ncbi:MAG: hypothetical protein MZU79_05045 [Anaerotruncus sp.]|nr:hypothetical protein [Anaerotruncus sp.]
MRYGRCENRPLSAGLSRAAVPVRLFDLLRMVRPQGLRQAAEPDGADPYGPLRPAPAHRRLRQAAGQGGRRPRGRGQEALLGPAGHRPGRRRDGGPAPARLELRPGSSRAGRPSPATSSSSSTCSACPRSSCSWPAGRRPTSSRRSAPRAS